MLFRSHKPRAPLAQLVEDFWLYEHYLGDHPRELILPNGTFEIVFNLREDELRIYGAAPGDAYRRFSGAVISGPYAGSFMSDAAEETAIMGIHFKPGGAYPILAMPAGEFANTHVDLAAVWGSGASELRERLCALPDAAQRFAVLERALMARLADAPIRRHEVHWAVELFARTHGQTRIRDAARATGLGQRRFTELFAAEVGLAPKLFSRVQRFRHAATFSRNAARAAWAQIAADCGYFDQSHLIRDFVEFSGLSPTDYAARQGRLERAGAHVKRHHLPLAE